jgi:acyl dehydratase
MGEVPDLSWVPGGAVPAEYADISRDRSGIHLDEQLAREQGLPGVILHGMHVFGQVVSHLDRHSPPGTVLSVSCRFADVSVPGERIDVRFASRGSALEFTGEQAGRPVVTAGVATVEAPGTR